MRRSLFTVAVAVALSGSLGLAQAQAAEVQVATKKFGVKVVQTEKAESDQRFKMTRTGKVKYTVTKKTWDHAVGFRLISCGGNWRALTGWKDFRKNYGDYYTFDKKLNRGQCFRVQAGRSWAGYVDGKVKGDLKSA